MFLDKRSFTYGAAKSKEANRLYVQFRISDRRLTSAGRTKLFMKRNKVININRRL